MFGIFVASHLCARFLCYPVVIQLRELSCYHIQSAKSCCLNELELVVNKGKADHGTVTNIESKKVKQSLYRPGQAQRVSGS